MRMAMDDVNVMPDGFASSEKGPRTASSRKTLSGIKYALLRPGRIIVALAILGSALSLQPAFATIPGNCLPDTATKIENPADLAVLNAPTGELITAVSIKAGTECFVTPANARGTVQFDDCYAVEDLASAQSEVRRVGDGPGCKDISHIQFVTAPARELRVCKIAGTGIDVGTAFNFTAGQKTLVVSAGPEPDGSCAVAGLFPAGNQVAVSETIPSGVVVSAVACAGGAACSDVDLAAGEVTVTIGGESNEVIYTNERIEPPSPELCGDGLDNNRNGIVDEGCIGDRAWLDTSFDGIQDAGEPGLAGVTFNLYTSDHTLVASTVSDASGTYYFSNVPAGTYYVEAIHPHFAAPPDVGPDDTRDSDFSGVANVTAVFAFPADGSLIHLDAGFNFDDDGFD